MTCYNCDKKGHYAKTCPKKEVNKGQIHTQASKDIHKEENEETEGDELGYIYHQNLPGLIWEKCRQHEPFNDAKMFRNIH